jgi:hypothetical protein
MSQNFAKSRGGGSVVAERKTEPDPTDPYLAHLPLRAPESTPAWLAEKGGVTDSKRRWSR